MLKREDPLYEVTALAKELRRVKSQGWSVVVSSGEIIVRPKDRTIGKFSIHFVPDESCCVMFFSQELNYWNKSRYFNPHVSPSVLKVWMESEAARPLKPVESNWKEKPWAD